MGGPQSSHGLPALWNQDPRQQQRTCRFLYASCSHIKCTYLSVPADEDWTEDPGEEALRCSDEADVLRSVCGWRGEIFLHINNNTINLLLSPRTPGQSPRPSTE